MKVIVIGGGPAGMMAAITSAEQGNEVVLIEKNKLLGKKLSITGKGRCNITSSLNIDEFIKNTPGNGKFLFSAFNSFTNKDIIDFIENHGIKTKVERGNRVFPVTDKAQDVVNCFTKKLKELNVSICLNTLVKDILIDNDNKAIGVMTNNKKIKADKIILATGGKSYPLTGSTGDGYKFAKKLGHTITELKPSLVPLVTYEAEMHKTLQGLSLKNVEIKLVDISKNKEIYSDFGEMLFTHFGVSGPIVLSASSHLVRYKNIIELLENKQIKLLIDFKPALSKEKLDQRILRDFEEEKNKSFKNSLDKLLPQKLIPEIVNKSNIGPNKKVNSITKEERENLLSILKQFEVTIKDFRPIEDAIITAGGISIKEINPKTMESKIIKDLYFAGEIIDVDAYTGGFNLQIAYSTGYVAGN